MEMKVKTVYRTIHPDTHKAENSYRVRIGKRNYYDQLLVHIDHEKVGVIGTYVFERSVIAPYESIHFKASERGGKVSVNWVQDLVYKIIDQSR